MKKNGTPSHQHAWSLKQKHSEEQPAWSLILPVLQERFYAQPAQLLILVALKQHIEQQPARSSNALTQMPLNFDSSPAQSLPRLDHVPSTSDSITLILNPVASLTLKSSPKPTKSKDDDTFSLILNLAVETCVNDKVTHKNISFLTFTLIPLTLLKLNMLMFCYLCRTILWEGSRLIGE